MLPSVGGVVPVDNWAGGVGFGCAYPNGQVFGSDWCPETFLQAFGVRNDGGAWEADYWYTNITAAYLELWSVNFLYSSVKVEIQRISTNNSTSYLQAWHTGAWHTIDSIVEDGTIQYLEADIPNETTILRVYSVYAANHGVKVYNFLFS